MTPSLPVALAILTFLSIPAVAAPAPDFEPVSECDQAAHKKYGVIKGFVESADADRLMEKLSAIHAQVDALTAATDELAWPLENARALPAGCRIGEEKVKEGVYEALSGLRKGLDEKVQSALPEDERSPSADLTAREREADALMGSAKSLEEFKSKAAGLRNGIQPYAGGGQSEAITKRATSLAKRLGGFFKRIAQARAAGAKDTGVAIPKEVLDREAKNAAKSKKGADASKGFTFGDKIDDAQGGPQTAEDRNEGNRGGAATGEIQGSGADRPDAPIEAKKPGRSRVERAVDTAEIDEDTDPDEPDSSALSEAAKNSATKPLGGAVNPPAADDATLYAKRKAEARKAAERVSSMANGREKAEAEMDLVLDRGFVVQSLKLQGSSGELVLERNRGVPERLRFGVKNWELSPKPAGVLTPEEEGVIEAELEERKRAAQAR